MLVFYLLVLRFLHVIASVAWAGGAAIFFLFIEPTAKALAPTIVGLWYTFSAMNPR